MYCPFDRSIESGGEDYAKIFPLLKIKGGRKLKKRKYSFLNLLLWSLSALLVLMAGAGLLLGVWNVGSTGLLLTAAVLAATAVVRRRKKRREWMMTTIALLLVAGLAVHAAVWNYFAYGRPAPKQAAQAAGVCAGIPSGKRTGGLCGVGRTGQQ